MLITFEPHTILDIITLPGYKFVMINRKTITKNGSGGIMVGFKDNLAKHIL
jgi:hypothetical protein